MAALTGLTIIKRFSYRGDGTEEYANTYHFTGDPPSDSASWKSLADALIAKEKTLLPATASIVHAYGYSDDSETPVAVWSYDYLEHSATVPGVLPITGGTICPGDSAVWARWKTDRLNSRGKPVYLRKYFHPAIQGAAVDTVLAAQKTVLETFATQLWDGSFVGGRTIRSRTHADTILGSGASTYVTTRTLKRRGRRP